MPRTRLSHADLLLLAALLAAGGVVVASYLTWQWYAEANSTWCDLSSYFSCSRVRESPFAHIGPIPTAAVGLAGFVILLALAAMSLRGVERVWRWSPDRWLVGFAALGASLGAGLTAVEVFVIQAVCILCAASFALALGILGLAVLLARAP